MRGLGEAIEGPGEQEDVVDADGQDQKGNHLVRKRKGVTSSTLTETHKDMNTHKHTNTHTRALTGKTVTGQTNRQTERERERDGEEIG